MNKNKYLHSVLPSSKPKKYPRQSSLINKLNLQNELQGRGLKIKLKENLKGGFISQVYSADLEGQLVVVKHTEGAFPFDPTELYLDKKSHKVDVQVLKNLQNSSTVKVPKLLYDFPEISTSIMENLYLQGFSLMQDDIFKKRFFVKAAESVGRSLTYLTIESRKWEEFPDIVQNAQMSIYERGLELRLAYPNSQKEYLNLEKEFLSNNRYFSWPDCHPKNIFCQYLAMEVFHRANGKWVAGVETKEQKLSLLKFDYTVFDEKINSIDQLIKLLNQ